MRRGTAGVAAVLGALMVLSALAAPWAQAETAAGPAQTPVALAGTTSKPTTEGAFVSIAPTRFLDTRNSAPVSPDGTVSFQVGGVNGIPSDAAAVVFNLTVTGAKSAGFITAYASGTERPNSSNVNFAGGQTVPNSVAVPVGVDGKVTLFNRSSGTTELIADVSGYYLPGAPTVPGAFVPINPTRLLDTRSSSPAGPDGTVSFQVGGVVGIPEDQTVPNSVTVPVGADGKVTVFNRSSGTSQLIADVSGYYLAGTPTVAGAFVPVPPNRFLDTRDRGPVGPDGVVSFQVGDRPGSSNVNFTVGQTVPNSVTVPVGSDGKVTLFNRSSANSQLIADVSGYYLPGATTSSAFVWGDNSAGQLGNGTVANSLATIGVAGWTDVVMVAQGRENRFALRADGTVWAWGLNHRGQLGDGTTEYRFTPVRVLGLTGVISVVADIHSDRAYALLADGTVRAWGDNYEGQLGNGTTGYSPTTGYNEATGYSSVPVQVVGLKGVTSLSAGFLATYAVLADGTVRAWGTNATGELGDGTTIDRNAPVQVAGLTCVESLSVSYGNAYALLTDGTVRSWGDNYSGELGSGSSSPYSSTPVQVAGLAGVASLTSTGFGGYALLTDGTVRAWGSHAGELGGGPMGQNSALPVKVPGLTGVASISAASDAPYAVLADGTVRAWGFNVNGQVGNGTTTYTPSPARVTGLTRVASITSNGYSTYALLTDGTVRAWGYNGEGQLCNGTTVGSRVPVQVQGLANVKNLTM
ncbi:RCC1 domain-containing protein [Arthrobacter sp. FW306-04-A]|uniref:RCC1 domain-containing protein n=1 Tax=Arthrobacter sp. FW306-04-A TaxID=2879619 RepID=UPI0037BF3EF2|nr:hypothetical protein LFT43_19320 [Arthrobacter sp. FW306-04-A]